MTYIKYSDKKISDARMKIIRQAVFILEEENKHVTMTVRQLYYQFVKRNWIENKQSEYKRFTEILSDGRMAGLISWDSIEDRGRALRGLPTYSGPNSAIQEMIDKFRLDLWDDQKYYPEVWVEKQALEGVLAEICNKLRVNFFATKGNNSQSEQWRAGQRFAQKIRDGKIPIVFHLADHDPSGLDMTRDNQERLNLFTGTGVQVVRIALNRDQVDAHRPPPNPVKFGRDSKAEKYALEHGDYSWELDALTPRQIQEVIQENVEMIRDDVQWQQSLEDENMALRDLTERMDR